MRNFTISLFFAFCFIVCTLPSFSNSLIAQNRASDKAKADSKQEEEEIPPAEEVGFETSDGVMIKATWFPGTNAKETVPVLLLHDLGEGNDRSAMLPLAEHLQTESGMGVLVPDLRGHGASTTAAGVEDPLEYGDFKKSQIASVARDIEACKKFLMRKNNAAELNIELLTVLASHNTCIHAMNWAASDWSWATLPDGTKQGQDVKALILLSPVRKYRGLNMNAALKAPIINGALRGGLTICIFYGRQDETTEREGGLVYEALLKKRLDPDEIEEEDMWRLQTLFRIRYKNSDSVGDDLLSAEDATSAKILNSVNTLIQNKLIDFKDELRWTDRSSK